MPKAEVGSTKYLANKMKAKGLQRLRWYCQICERQMRDENGFRQHTQSEGHVRQMLVVGESSGKYIADYSNQFKRDFLQLLRTSHGEKKVNLNHFYQEYIRNKEHVHMNATRWASLTEFGKYLGREGICRVEEGDKGLELAWIDNSPEALRRQDAIRKKERQDKGDEEREQKLIAQQVERAQRQAEEKTGAEVSEEAKLLDREKGEKISLNFGRKDSETTSNSGHTALSSNSKSTEVGNEDEHVESSVALPDMTQNVAAERQPSKLGLSFNNGGKPKNVFSNAARKNALGGSRPAPKVVLQKPMSEAERIMKEELQRKRLREVNSQNGPMPKKARA